MIVKCLSIKRPWSYLITYGSKTIENRTWKTDYRGQLWIHSSKKWDRRARNPFELFTQAQYQRIHRAGLQAIATMDENEIKGGYLIGRVDLVDCVQGIPRGKWEDVIHAMWALRADNKSDGWHWLLEPGPALKEPIEMKGGLGIFEREIPAGVELG